jgi:glycosyltransferase involved in cell wall biosynthesis
LTPTSQPRVLHIVPALFGTAGIVGGAERYALELARHMADRVATRLIAFGPATKDIREGNLDVHVIGGAWQVRGQRTNPFTLAVVPEILTADIVHCHQHHILMSSTTAAICRLTGRRVFATDLGGGGWDVSAYVSTNRWFNAHLHISEYSRHISGHDGKPWARVILGGVDTVKFSPGANAARTRALFVGRLLPHKGLTDLIAAVPDTIALDIVGPMNATGAVESFKTQSAGKAIAFHHDVADEALVEMYRSALCLVLPSVYRTSSGEYSKVPELLGQTLLEAMACGTPVICTRVASMPEIVEDGISGFIVEPGDQSALRARLEWLSAHPVDADAMGAAGRARVLAHFQWHDVVERCLDAYRTA